jgi:tetratricopeptide (TPR) repeat protein
MLLGRPLHLPPLLPPHTSSSPHPIQKAGEKNNNNNNTSNVEHELPGTVSTWRHRLWIAGGIYLELLRLVLIWAGLAVPLERFAIPSKREERAAHVSVELGVRFLRRLHIGVPPAALVYLALASYNLARISNSPLQAEMVVVLALVVDLLTGRGGGSGANGVGGTKGGFFARLREYVVGRAVNAVSNHDRLEALYLLYGLRSLAHFEKGHWTATRATVACLLHVNTIATNKNLALLRKLSATSNREGGSGSGQADASSSSSSSSSSVTSNKSGGGDNDVGDEHLYTTKDIVLGDIKDNYDGCGWGLCFLSGVEFAHGKFASSLAWSKLALSVSQASGSPFPLVSSALLYLHSVLVSSATNLAVIEGALKLEQAAVADYMDSELVRGLPSEMTHHGLLALAQWRLGNFDDALANADRALSVLKAMPHRNLLIFAIHLSLPVFVDVYLELWEIAVAEQLPSARVLEERIDTSLSIMRNNMGFAAILEPELERLVGWMRAVQGRLTEAATHWKNALRASRAIVSPYCEAKVLFLAGVFLDRPAELLDLATVSPAFHDAATTSRDALVLAQSQFTQLGADFDAQQCDVHLTTTTSFSSTDSD